MAGLLSFVLYLGIVFGHSAAVQQMAHATKIALLPLDPNKKSLGISTNRPSATAVIRSSITPSSSPTTTLKPLLTPTSTTTPSATVIPTQTTTIKPANTPRPTPTATASLGLAQMEQQIVDLTNQERAKNGLPALAVDAKLANVARAHSQDMVKRNFFNHTNPDGFDPFQRMKNAGITYTSAGENIAQNYSVQAAFQSWLDSPGHEANIVKLSFGHIGVGIARGPGGYYFTQDFTN